MTMSSVFAPFSFFFLLFLQYVFYVDAQSYTLADAYMPNNFFSMFDFYTVRAVRTSASKLHSDRAAGR